MAVNGSAKESPLDFTKFYNVINGKLESTAETRCSVNPSTLENNPPVPVSTQKDVDKAVAAANVAADSWADVPLEERRKAMRLYADAIDAHREEFAQMLTKEQGKPVTFAQAEVEAGADYFRTFAGIDLPEKTYNAEGTQFTRYLPIGVAVGIVPWNFPVSICCGKIGPAVATGNAVIIKASPFTPYCNLKLVELAQRFFPPGVVQVLSGDDGLGPMLTEHPGVGKVSFTGSTATGKKVMASCAKTLKRVTLELGGNDPAIVCADVDPVAVAPKVAQMAVFNSGQICIAIKRVYIHESVYPAVVSAMVDYLKSLKVADGFEKDAFMGPICNRLQYERVQNLLQDIESSKLNVAHGSTKTENGSKGYFVMPTLIDNPPDDSRIVVEEPFGPVFPVLKWSDEADVIARANNTDYGLGASVWTRDKEQGSRMARKLKAGTVWVNHHADIGPNRIFGGHKHSGIGVEFGSEGMLAYCNAQTVGIKDL